MNAVKAIEAKDLTKYHGDFLAIVYKNLDVNQGEFFGFLDLNGDGKSMTIWMLTEQIIDFGEDRFE